MNLLRDPWIPMEDCGKFRHVTLREVLCAESERRVRLGRDDMELAALQLAICLTQVLLTPADVPELRERAERPISGEIYDTAAAPLADWFDLRHEKHPFMQTCGVLAKEATPVQKLFTGLPAGHSACFFNTPGDISAVCPACAAIALFNQAANAPSFGGGFKGSLRGGAPVTTLISEDNLRKTIWRNVLHRKSVGKLISEKDWGKPVWVEPIDAKQSIPVSSIGFLRGLFWQPARLELSWEQGNFKCTACGTNCPEACREFKTEKFSYSLGNNTAQWPHPHGPRRWNLKNGAKNESFVTFRKTIPAWTQLSGFLLEHEKDKEGWTPAPVVVQYREAFRGKRLHLTLGGYENKQAKILKRRHELVGLAQGWDENLDHVRGFIDRALAVKDVLRKKSYGFGKQLGLPDLARLAEQRFYAGSEDALHKLLRAMDWKKVGPARQRLTEDLGTLAEGIFEALAAPYLRQPKALREYVKWRHALRAELAKLRREA